MSNTVCGYLLDSQQQAIVLDESKHLLVVAGAGSGKTLTILGKIQHLLQDQNYLPEDILCISFTRVSANSLEQKIEKQFSSKVSVYTFHQLALSILKKNYEIAESDLLENIIHDFLTITILDYPSYMECVLTFFQSKKRKNIQKNYQQFCEKYPTKLQQFELLLSTFIHLLKCNHYALNDFPIFLKEIRKTFSFSKYKQEKSFLILALNIYLLYQDYLSENQEMDFDDMILLATEQVEQEGVSKPYRYIIIDEYQDTSYIRFCLIRKILEKTNASLMVVGDDFQSIYQFTGCDIDLFLNFQHYFPDATIRKIERTYRNSQELIQCAGRFIQKNKKQIPKQLYSKKRLKKPIQICYYSDIRKEFKKIITQLGKTTKKPIMILGRNNQDIRKILDNEILFKSDGTVIYQKDPTISMYFLTIHKSKGLEEENVIILNLENNLLGFPSQIQANPILRLVTRVSEKYPYSEERRLFYVALTRTKNYVYLLVPKKNPSIFIREIQNYI